MGMLEIVTLLTALLGGAGVFLLLPRPKPFPVLWGAVPAIAALAVLFLGVLPMANRPAAAGVEWPLFVAFTALALAGAVTMLASRDPARAALCFAQVVLATCGLFMLLAAPFLMAATIIIYAGAIVVTFLFVIMLSQSRGPTDADDRSREPELGALTGALLAGLLVFVVLRQAAVPAGLDSALSRAAVAARQTTIADIVQALGKPADSDPKAAIKELADDARKGAAEVGVRVEDEQGRPTRMALHDDDRAAIEQAATKLHEDVVGVEVTPESLRAALGEFRARALAARDRLFSYRPTAAEGSMSPFAGTPANTAVGNLQIDADGRPLVPAENVAAVGRALFTDYLLAVELGGTLLLVATVGAIAIAGRRLEARS